MEKNRVYRKNERTRGNCSGLSRVHTLYFATALRRGATAELFFVRFLLVLFSPIYTVRSFVRLAKAQSGRDFYDPLWYCCCRRELGKFLPGDNAFCRMSESAATANRSICRNFFANCREGPEGYIPRVGWCLCDCGRAFCPSCRSMNESRGCLSFIYRW